MRKNHGFLKRNGLLIVFLSLMVMCWFGQAYTGFKENNEERIEKQLSTLSFGEYLTSGHFIQATFENWESEFLQMGLYVIMTVFLFQKGSAESKRLDQPEEVDRKPVPHAKAPWPVRKGGIYLKIYENSLSLAFAFLFILSFFLHAYGTMKDINEEQHKSLTVLQTIMENRFWFESLQNWQSEFLSVASIVLLSIYLRQMGSPESKPVDTPHDENG